jgi:hypothetical protein
MSAIEDFLQHGEEPKTVQPGVWYLRLKPYDRRANHLLRRLKISKWNIAIREQKGWHRVQNKTMACLQDLFDMQPADKYAPKALDICTYEEARLTEKREREAAVRAIEVRADVEHAHVLSSADLPSTSKSRTSAATEARKAKREAEKAAETEREERRVLRKAEAAAMTEAERAAEIERLQREKAAKEAELEAMDAEDEVLAVDGDEELETLSGLFGEDESDDGDKGDKPKGGKKGASTK